MWKYAVIFSYLGTDFCGWQKQKGSAALGKPSIQGTIESAIQRMTGEKVSVVGSGRTDSGVHAVGQVAHFVLEKKAWDPQILLRGINGLLPLSIRAISVQNVLLHFHAQRSAVRKQYSYYFQQGPCPLPHFEPLSWWIRKELDFDAMAEALKYLKGQYDFRPFQASGGIQSGSTVRTILEADISRHPIAFPCFLNTLLDRKVQSPLEFVRIRVVGTGFLKQMVRGIAGTLLQVGEQKRNPLCIQEIIRTQNRSLVGPTAPARALWLEQVWYPEEFQIHEFSTQNNFC